MTKAPDRDPEQERRQARANELMLRVGLRLLSYAKQQGEFAIEADELSSRLAQLDEELGEEVAVVAGSAEPIPPPSSGYVVEVDAQQAERVKLCCRYGPDSLSAELRIDGVLENELSGVSFSFASGDHDQATPLSAEEVEVMRKAGAALAEEHEEELPRFEGAVFVRALAAPAQPAAAVRILAVELFGDGLIVHYAYDDPVDVGVIPLSFYGRAGMEPPIERLLSEASEAGGNLEPLITVADDLGTVYRQSGGGGGGVQTVRGADQFVPTVPAAANRLLISTYAGTVAVEL